MGGLQGLQPTTGLLQPTATRDQEGPREGPGRGRRARTARRIRIAQYSTVYVCMYSHTLRVYEDIYLQQQYIITHNIHRAQGTRKATGKR
jgi:hypothetical protein